MFVICTYLPFLKKDKCLLLCSQLPYPSGHTFLTGKDMILLRRSQSFPIFQNWKYLIFNQYFNLFDMLHFVFLKECLVTKLWCGILQREKVIFEEFNDYIGISFVVPDEFYMI